MKINKKINYITMTSLCIIAAIICIIAFTVLSANIIGMYNNTLSDLAISTENNISEHLEDQLVEARFIASMRSLSVFLTENYNNTENSSEAVSARAEVFNYIYQKAQTNNHINSINIVDNDGVVLLSNDTATMNTDISDTEYYKEMSSGRSYSAGAFMNGSDLPFIIIRYPINIYNKQYGQLFITVSFKRLTNYLNEYNFGTSGSMFYVMPNSAIFSTNSAQCPASVYDIYNYEETVGLSSDNVLITTLSDSYGNERFAACKNVSNLNIMLVTSIDKSEVLLVSVQSIIPIIVLFVFLIAMIMYFMHFINKKIMHPLNLFNRTLSFVTNGDLRARFNYNKPDEFGRLSKLFNNAMYNFQSLTASLVERDEKNRIILDSVTDVIWEYNIKTQEVSLSANWKNFANIPDHQINDKTVYSLEEFIELFYKSDSSSIYNELMNCAESGINTMIECRLNASSALNNEQIWIRITGTCIKNKYAESIKIIGALQNISERKNYERQLNSVATRDDLTGLLKRNPLNEIVTKDIANYPNEKRYLLFVDVDHFKDINDNYGHLVGDKALIRISRNITDVFGEYGEIARFGGDEFVIYINVPITQKHLENLSTKLLDEVSTEFSIDDNITIKTSCSIGIAAYPTDGKNYFDLTSAADSAAYKAKYTSRNCFKFYTEPSEII